MCVHALSDQIIAVYSQDAYPSASVVSSIKNYRNTKVNTLIIAGLSGVPGQGIVYTHPRNLMFDIHGTYVGDDHWSHSLAALTAQTGIEPTRILVSLSDSATVVLAGMTPAALASCMSWLKDNGIGGVDLDCHQLGPMSSSVTKVTQAAIQAGLALTAAPRLYSDHWQQWCNFVTSHHGVVAWLNLPCYAMGIVCDPVQWTQRFETPVPIVPGFTVNPSELGYLTPSQAQSRLASWQARCSKYPLTGAFTSQKGSLNEADPSLESFADALYNGLSCKGYASQTQPAAFTCIVAEAG